MAQELVVVIVDDKKMITDLLENYIQFSNTRAKVHTFNDAFEALDFIKKNKKIIDIIITDYKMPGINGIELLEQTAPTATRIMISGYLSELAEEKLKDLNAIFFEKPVPMKKIGKIINEKIQEKP